MLKKLIALFEPLVKPQEEGSMDYVFVSTPQHSSRPDSTHYAFNFENNGWNLNPSKGCFEIYMMQYGLIDKNTWLFSTLETKKGAHNISFNNRECYEKFRILNINQ